MVTLPIDPVAGKRGLYSHVMARIGRANIRILSMAPPEDWDTIESIALLFIATFVYQATLLTFCSYKIFGSGETFSISYAVGPILICLLFYFISSYTVLQSGHHTDGIAQLQRGGVKLPMTLGTRLKAPLFMVFRFALGFCMALNCGTAANLDLFHDDIAAYLDSSDRTANSAASEAATRDVDGQLAVAGEAEKTAAAQLTNLQTEVAAAHNGIVDPSANDAGIQSEEAEISDLLALKSQREQELYASEKFSDDELGGIRGGPGNSGIPGDGPRRKSAQLRVQEATANAAAAEQSLTEARNRLDQLRHQFTSGVDGQVSRAQAALPELQRDLQAAIANANALRDNLTKLTNGRDAAIHAALINSPDYVAPNHGILAQIRALRGIAKDPETAAVIVLIDVTAFLIELGALLAKVLAFNPTVYSAILARDAYLHVVRLAESLDAELHPSSSAPEQEDDPLPPISPHGIGANRGTTGVKTDEAVRPNGLANGVDFAGPPLVKRRPGRPRKDRTH